MRHYVEQVSQLNFQSLKFSSNLHETVLQFQVSRQFAGIVQTRRIPQRMHFLAQIGLTLLHSRQNNI